jgi:cell division protein FtsL
LKQLGRVTAALLLVILIMGGVIAYTIVNSQGESSTVQSQSSVIQGQASAIQSQSSAMQSQSSALSKSGSTVMTLEANITANAKLLRADNAQVTNLTSTISLDEAKIAAIESGYAQANKTIATGVGPLQTQVASLQTEVTGLQTQVSGLQAQLSSAQAKVVQLTSITSLGTVSVKISQQLVGIPSIGNQVATSFTANYSGYVTVSMSSISNIAAVQAGVIIVFGPSVNSGQYSSEPIGPFSFTTVPDTLVFPITPGAISVYLSNSANTPGNATITVTYYY